MFGWNLALLSSLVQEAHEHASRIELVPHPNKQWQATVHFHDGTSVKGTLSQDKESIHQFAQRVVQANK